MKGRQHTDICRVDVSTATSKPCNIPSSNGTMSDIEGSCHCGAITLRIVGGFGDDAKSFICHCEPCQVLSGSLFACTAFVASKNLQVVRGTPKPYKQSRETNSSGMQVTRHFCGDCGTPLWGESEVAPSGSFVRTALFGNTLPPKAEVFWKRAHEWEKPMVPPGALFEAGHGPLTA
ncbi:Mss4-like protein [Rhodofomes roseus]|uniref:Mss4-like protein n=1 Tax=Rhodofomes roseus TaxID=34475 RepID=A0ABQ8K0D1_9APHY|nr:Mss4-like protein [Rhodofomes roseus]KAH9830092.1 Mss4-like protein [Rhodofomes roseus]